MTDITKCKGDGCPMKKSCHRFTAPDDEYQSYFVESPIKDGKCDMYCGEVYRSIMDALQDILDGKA
jgi:hypothetical protein